MKRCEHCGQIKECKRVTDEMLCLECYKMDYDNRASNVAGQDVLTRMTSEELELIWEREK